MTKKELDAFVTLLRRVSHAFTAVELLWVQSIIDRIKDEIEQRENSASSEDVA
jgi:hypothetical protein